MNPLTSRVEGKISGLLPLFFRLIFDGWLVSNKHYFFDFASHPAEYKPVYEQVLVGFFPFEDESTLTSDAHGSFIEYVLSI